VQIRKMKWCGIGLCPLYTIVTTPKLWENGCCLRHFLT
jgi:hypothetical protein